VPAVLLIYIYIYIYIRLLSLPERAKETGDWEKKLKTFKFNYTTMTNNFGILTKFLGEGGFSCDILGLMEGPPTHLAHFASQNPLKTSPPDNLQQQVNN